MIIVSDTSPLVVLIHLQIVSILQQLFTTVIIPKEVFNELLRARIIENDFAVQYPFIKISSPINVTLVKELNTQVDLGEAEAIALAIELKADWILMDEKKGRMKATGYQLNTLGTLGILLDAKLKGVIPEIKPLIERMQKEIGFWISERILTSILLKAKE